MSPYHPCRIKGANNGVDMRMGSIWHENRNKAMLLIFCIWALAAVVLFSGHPDRNSAIALVWLLIVPMSYRVLAEQETLSTGILGLPSVPIGSEWQPKAPRKKNERIISRRERASKDMGRLLQRLGYSSNSLANSDADIIAQSPEGKNLVVKVLDGEAGILACQDAMKAMLDSGASEAIVLAPQGSTSHARRFVRKIRSRKGLHIRICNDTQSIDFTPDSGNQNPGKN
ncbi:MAG: hypothetical protein HXS50_02390 [Theionarchaea archaeon]|nr:hypothetical protein [Theionarchaea archaeon]